MRILFDKTQWKGFQQIKYWLCLLNFTLHVHTIALKVNFDVHVLACIVVVIARGNKHGQELYSWTTDFVGFLHGLL